MAEKIKITYEGYKALEEEYDTLKGPRKKEVAQKLKDARAQGDLSENAEYEAAKEEMNNIEARISEIEVMMKNIEIVEEDTDTSKVSIGCYVKILDIEFDEEDEYKIVGSTETDSLAGKISSEAPLGQALMGRSAGEIVTYESLDGPVQVKILEIWKNN